MALRFLVDTSVLKRLGHHEVRRVVESLADRGELARATICDLEVGYSARNAVEWDELQLALDAFAPV
ncbi:MAG: PIN domain nuclease, partial [Acidimicrobiales bacterium]